MPPTVSLRDFSTDPKRLAVLCAYAVVVGIGAGALAKILLVMIGTITHIIYYHSFATHLVPPDPHNIGPAAILVPALGGVLVGLIARYGTDKIRGHGIPEAIASILQGNSIIRARVALWKPLASAITIGTGGPFGAEGPIIMTGGAFGSLLAQYLRLTSAERRTLLVCGAAAGMSATFGSPIAAVLIAVELLLFEWRPRSFVPVAVASFVAFGIRHVLIGTAPPFAAPSIVAAPQLVLWAVFIGLAGGIVSMLMTKLVYWTEDLYERLPIHWMWWPALGGLIVGIGGWFVPQALGVGYPAISAMVNGHMLLTLVVPLIAVKIVIWIASLSSGTSGGVLAPLLMIGAALGTIVAAFIPGHPAAACAIVGMAAVMGGTMRAPFMGTIFALETTHAWPLAAAVFAGCIAATAFTVAFVPRSILTEKLSRRGLHVAREYSVHPLELIAVRDVMRPKLANADEAPAILADARVRSAADLMAELNVTTLRVLDERGDVVGVIASDDLLRAWRQGMSQETQRRRIRGLRLSALRSSDRAVPEAPLS